MPVNYELFNLSDTGKIRSNNEDYFATYQNSEWLLLILCDGMGGVKGGRTASTLTVKTIGEYFKKNFREPVSFFEESVAAANQAVLERASKQPQLKGMGSTLVLVLYNDNEIYYAHVGDSRLYLYRNGKLVQLTRDHSYVNEMVDRGLIKREEAHSHEYKNRITRCIGQVNSKPTISSVPYKVEENDIFMMCSDGLTDMVVDQEIEKIFHSSANIEVITKKLIEKANANGGKDNITVQLLRVTKKPQNGIRLKAHRKKKSGLKKPIIFSVAVVLLLLVFWQGFQNMETIKKTARQIVRKSRSNKKKTGIPLSQKGALKEFMLIGQKADSFSLKTPVSEFNYYLSKGTLIGYMDDDKHTPVISKGAPPMPGVVGKPLKKVRAMLDSIHFHAMFIQGDSLLAFKLSDNNTLQTDVRLDSLHVKSCLPPEGQLLSDTTEIQLVIAPPAATTSRLTSQRQKDSTAEAK